MPQLTASKHWRQTNDSLVALTGIWNSSAAITIVGKPIYCHQLLQQYNKREKSKTGQLKATNGYSCM